MNRDGGGDVARQPQQAGSVSGRGDRNAHQVDRCGLDIRHVDVVAQIRLVPVEGGRIGEHPDGVVVKDRRAI